MILSLLKAKARDLVASLEAQLTQLEAAIRDGKRNEALQTVGRMKEALEGVKKWL